MYEITLLNSTTDSESLWMVLSILCTQPLFYLKNFFYRKFISLIFLATLQRLIQPKQSKEVTIVAILIWFSLKVGESAQYFNLVHIMAAGF